MLLIINYKQFNNNYIDYGDKNNNNIINNSYFYSITYSNSLFSINYLYIEFKLNNINVENYFNKYKITINNFEINKEYIDFLISMEKQILNKFSINQKHIMKLSEQLRHNNLRGLCNYNIENKKYNLLNFLIKISGIWENNNEIGLIYKVIII
jgi:CRISPR/Cas system-associated protein endoribonuclease Cas2